jgi:hypothetical protein
MDAPSPKELSEGAGISPSYASMILGKTRPCPRKVALDFYEKTGRQIDFLARLTKDEADQVLRLEKKAAA